MQKTELEKLQEIKDRVRTRAERKAKIANLSREIEKKKADIRKSANKGQSQLPPSHIDLEPDWLTDLNENLNSLTSMDAHQRQLITSSIPAPNLIKARITAFNKSNTKLRSQADDLRAKSTKLEGLYRKVVALCTNVPEDKIDEALPALVAAVESERGALGEQDVGRVREFLKRTDPSGKDGELQQQEEGMRTGISTAISAAAAAERAERERMARSRPGAR